MTKIIKQKQTHLLIIAILALLATIALLANNYLNLHAVRSDAKQIVHVQNQQVYSANVPTSAGSTSGGGGPCAEEIANYNEAYSTWLDWIATEDEEVANTYAETTLAPAREAMEVCLASQGSAASKRGR